MSFAEEKLNNGKGIAETIKDVSRKIQENSRRGSVKCGFISAAKSPGARKLFESWGYVEVSPNYWERKK